MPMKSREALRKKRMTLLLLAIVLLAAAVLAAFALLNARGNQGETIRGSLEGRLTGTPQLDIGGTQYPYNRDLVNILVMGIDRASGEDRKLSLRSNGQADFLLLISIDEKRRTVNFLQIDRDTMAEVTMLTVLGQDAGTRLAQICLAHGFGGTRERSSQLTLQAVERLLFGVHIDRFVSLNMYDIGAISGSLGGIPVMITQDMTAIDPSFIQGGEALLTGDLANRFVRQRYGVGDGSNQARMARQQAFMASFQGKLKAEIAKGQQAAGNFCDVLTPYLFTDLSKGYMVNLLYQTRDFQVGEIVTLNGVHRVGPSGFMEFYPDQSALQERIIERFTIGN